MSPLRKAFSAYKYRRRIRRALHELSTRIVTPRPHGLPAPLIVSLTSYPARFPTLAPTLKGLLSQTLRPDQVILWLADGDEAALPHEVLDLVGKGLTLGKTRNLRSFTKIIPALETYPDSYIVTADDDLYYRATWLERLVTGARAHPGRIIATRCHRIRQRDDGTLAPYRQWSRDIWRCAQSADIFATGVGGVLYPPGSLHPEVLDSVRFLALCPTADDIWLWYMARRQGSTVHHLRGKFRVLEWPGSQATNLHSRNVAVGKGNDAALAAMIAHFGLPDL